MSCHVMSENSETDAAMGAETQADEMTLIQANGRKFQSAGGTGMKNTSFVAPEAHWFCSASSKSQDV